MMDEELRMLRHDIRGKFNGIKLCVLALETEVTPLEAKEFLGDIEGLCEGLDGLMARWEALESAGGGAGG